MSQASIASTMGLRGNAIVTEVWSSIRSVVVAASAIVSMESWASSPHVMTSKPCSSALRAASGACFGHPPTPVTSFTLRTVQHRLALAHGLTASRDRSPAGLPCCTPDAAALVATGPRAVDFCWRRSRRARRGEVGSGSLLEPRLCCVWFEAEPARDDLPRAPGGAKPAHQPPQVGLDRVRVPSDRGEHLEDLSGLPISRSSLALRLPRHPPPWWPGCRRTARRTRHRCTRRVPRSVS